MECGISATGHDREVVDGINDTGKRFTFNLVTKVQLPGSQRFDTKMAIHTTTYNYDTSLAQEFKN